MRLGALRFGKKKVVASFAAGVTAIYNTLPFLCLFYDPDKYYEILERIALFLSLYFDSSFWPTIIWMSPAGIISAWFGSKLGDNKREKVKLIGIAVFCSVAFYSVASFLLQLLGAFLLAQSMRI